MEFQKSIICLYVIDVICNRCLYRGSNDFDKSYNVGVFRQRKIDLVKVLLLRKLFRRLGTKALSSKILLLKNKDFVCVKTKPSL